MSSVQKYFDDWNDIVYVDMADSILRKLQSAKIPVCPLLKDVFKAFKLCSFKNLKVVILGQDPYPNIIKGKPVATGIAFANAYSTSEKNYSPSLKVLRDSLINISKQEKHIIFDPSFERWEKQGVLMLNAALTCEQGKPDSHSLLWKPFITDFLTTLTMTKEKVVYLLMGASAWSLDNNLNPIKNTIIKVKHPSWYARTHTPMPSCIWKQVNKALEDYGKTQIEWI